jgi:acetyl-CoA carboxylase biotin carboxyl carrier protein
VALGAVLCIVEAMKVMNEIRADRPCVIRKILAENGKPVAGGQSLFLVDPAS